jgi:quinol monooxygenase YgiN
MFIVARFHAKPGSEDALHATIQRVIQPTRQEPGCVYARFFRSLKDPGLFFIHSNWRTEADFEAHVAQPHTVEFINSWADILDQPADVVRATECD